MRALGAGVAPASVAAGVGNMKVWAYSGLYKRGVLGLHGHHRGQLRWAFRARTHDTVDSAYAKRANNPIEDIESHYPLRVQADEIREDTAGPGKWRGRLARSATSFPGQCGMSSRRRRQQSRASALYGGGPGQRLGAVVFNPVRRHEQQLAVKIPDKGSADGDTSQHRQPVRWGSVSPLRA